MDSDRFDAVVKALATTGTRRRVLSGLLAAVVTGPRPGQLLAQEEIAAAGNGGTADASANGGAVATGNLNSGENTGHAIGVGDTQGSVAVDGGASANSTSLDVAAEGGTAISDASGGDENVAFIDESCPNVGACTGARNDCGPPDSVCGCWPTTEGESLCGQNFFCILATPCTTSADCLGGEACVATCCDQLACALPCGQFGSTEFGVASGDGRTALGR